MRLVFSLLLLPLMFGHALADEAPKAPAHRTRQTWQEHFAQANATHDGHLTMAEAKDGFALIARHFDDIDVDHKGYVTENDVRAWRVMRRAAHRLTRRPVDKLRPLHAFQLHSPNKPAAVTSRTAVIHGRVRLASRATRVGD